MIVNDEFIYLNSNRVGIEISVKNYYITWDSEVCVPDLHHPNNTTFI